MPKFNLLTEARGNPKTVKGEKVGYQTYILHLAPADLSGQEVCQWRTKGCTALCLNLAGRGGINKPGESTNAIQECRKRRTRLLFEDREKFLADLVADIDHAITYAAGKGLVAVFRLNGTSDLLWENFAVTRHGQRFENVFSAFPDVQFYDYTKAPYAARRHDIPNYHLTFSFAETLKNHLEAKTWYANGHNVSVVFGIKKTQPLPKAFKGAPVFNADETDLRFLDKRGIAGLHAKGNAWKRTPNGFIN
jgi:hypothetical protein